MGDFFGCFAPIFFVKWYHFLQELCGHQPGSRQQMVSFRPGSSNLQHLLLIPKSSLLERPGMKEWYRGDFFPPTPLRYIQCFVFSTASKEAPAKTRHWISGFIDFMFPKGNIPFIKPHFSPHK